MIRITSLSYWSFMYAHEYSIQVVENLAAGDREKEILVAISVYAVADKYDVTSICDPIVKHVEDLLSNKIKTSPRNTILSAILEAHYGGSGGAR
ncbi:hypothetical protein E8E11_000024, partial [Didymella keratinophila]